jgi:hypothetical protein
MSKESFKEYMKRNFPRANVIEESLAECAWQARQPEIDALKERIYALEDKLEDAEGAIKRLVNRYSFEL